MLINTTKKKLLSVLVLVVLLGVAIVAYAYINRTTQKTANNEETQQAEVQLQPALKPSQEALDYVKQYQSVSGTVVSVSTTSLVLESEDKTYDLVLTNNSDLRQGNKNLEIDADALNVGSVVDITFDSTNNEVTSLWTN